MDFASPNLPSRDYDATEAFYAKLGFERTYRDSQWLILKAGELMLEFFRYPDLDPAASSFGCCLRLDDLDAFYARCRDAGLPEAVKGAPRLHPPANTHWGGRMAAMIDLDGTLVRLIQN